MELYSGNWFLGGNKLKNKIEDFVDLSNRIIPQSVRTMIESLPIEGKEALVAFLDSNSDFSQHASFEVVSKQFLMDVSDSANRSVFHYTSLESLKKYWIRERF